MKTRLRAVVMAAILSLTLAALIAPVASAAPKITGPKIVDCGSYQTVANSAGTSWAGNESVSVYLQRGYPGYCTNWRAVGNLHAPDGCYYAHLYVQYLAGNWLSVNDDGFSYCNGDAASGGWDLELGTIIPAYLRARVDLVGGGGVVYATAYSYSVFQS